MLCKIFLWNYGASWVKTVAKKNAHLITKTSYLKISKNPK